MPRAVLPRPGALAGPWSPGGAPLPGTGRQVDFGMCIALASDASYKDGDMSGGWQEPWEGGQGGDPGFEVRAQGGCAVLAPVTPALR